MEPHKRREGTELFQAHAHHLLKIEESLKRHFSAHEPLVNEVVGHILYAGGKRIRPLLTVISGLLCEAEPEPLYRLAAVPEYLHAASLLHDDVVDEGQLRRGKLPAYKIWGNKTAVLAGDYLYAKAIHLAASFNIPSIASTIAETVAYMAEGEILQLQYATTENYGEELYSNVIFRKTAVLLGASCKIGALLGQVGHERAEALWDFGISLGMAFQIVDDLLDFTADQQELGKALGTDIAEGKRTLPLILAAQTADKETTAWLDSLMKSGAPGPDELIELRRTLESSGVIAETRARAEEYAQKAVAALAPFPESQEKKFLADLAEFVINRKK